MCTRALAANNYLTAVGSTKGQMVSVDLTADTDLHSLDGFRQLIVRQQNNTVVRLEDVATVELGAEDYDSGVTWNGSHSVFLAMQNAPKANVLQVAQAVRDALARHSGAAAQRHARRNRLRHHDVRPQFHP